MPVICLLQVETWGEQNGELTLPASSRKMGSVILYCIFLDFIILVGFFECALSLVIWYSLLWLDFSDVLCRYSLGTNPRGVKELVSLSYISYYTLGGWITYYIVVVVCCYSFVVIHACIIAIVLDMVPSSSSSWSFDICLKVLYYTYTL